MLKFYFNNSNTKSNYETKIIECKNISFLTIDEFLHLNPDFDCNIYNLLYLDNDSKNIKQYIIEHYIFEGFKLGYEGKFKNISKDFNEYYYQLLNPDLEYLCDNEKKYKLYIHYETIGFYEKRKYLFDNLPNDFNVNIYKYLYKDLRHMNNYDAIMHYLIFGRNEGRLYKLDNFPKDFNLIHFKIINKDLQNLSDFEFTKLFIENNFNLKYKLSDNYENIPKNFNIIHYQLLNTDLMHLTYDELIHHYINFGINENRKINLFYL